LAFYGKSLKIAKQFYIPLTIVLKQPFVRSRVAIIANVGARKAYVPPCTIGNLKYINTTEQSITNY
jgi:hypothetical protein